MDRFIYLHSLCCKCFLATIYGTQLSSAMYYVLYVVISELYKSFIIHHDISQYRTITAEPKIFTRQIEVAIALKLR